METSVKTNWTKFSHMDVISRILEVKGDESVNSFAKRLGINQKTLDHVVKGERKPSVSLIAAIAKGCNVSADWLLGLSTEKQGTVVNSHNVNSYNRGGDCSSCPLAKAAAVFLQRHGNGAT